MAGRRSVIFALSAWALLALLILLMNRGPGASVVVIIVWLALFSTATLSAITGIIFGVIGRQKPGKKLAVAGLAAGIFYLVTVSCLLALFIEFLRSVTD
jgi:hypothetical protein